MSREERKLYMRKYRAKNKYALAAKQREYDLKHKAKKKGVIPNKILAVTISRVTSIG
jgi:hypothetical protein